MSARSEFLVVKTAFALLVCLVLAGNSMAYTLPAPEFLGAVHGPGGVGGGGVGLGDALSRLRFDPLPPRQVEASPEGRGE